MLGNQFMKKIARRHIAGPDFKWTETICQWAQTKGWATTICYGTKSDEDKHLVAEEYIRALNCIAQKGFDAYLSIKPSALKFDLKLFEYIINEMQDKSIRIHFDSLSPDLAEESLRYFKEVKAMYANVGYTLPARWRRSIRDAEVVAEMNAPIRIVKGQWQDPDNYVSNVHENFLRLIEILAGRIPLISVATHDSLLVKKSVELMNYSDIDFEIEQYFSLPIIDNAILNGGNKNHLKTRIYVGYGEPFLPYNIWTVKERPATLGWFISDIFNLKQKFIHSDYHSTEVGV